MYGRVNAMWIGVVAAGAGLGIAACGDDDPGGPGGVSASVVGISQEVQQLQTLAQLNDAFASLGDLSNTIAPVMGPANPVPSIVPGERRNDTPRLDRSALSLRLPPSTGATLAVSAVNASLLLAPLGLTCIWGGSGWGIGQDLFGPVPQDQTFFELYETGSDGLPSDPPVAIPGNAFVSVRPGAQDPPSDIDVGVFVEQSGARILDVSTRGTVSGIDVFDIDIPDGSLSDGTNSLDFGLSATADARQIDLGSGPLSILESVALDASQEVFDVTTAISCTTCDSDNLTFSFRTTGTFPFTILSGDVLVDDEVVAQLSGSLASPNASVVGGVSAAEAALIADILSGVLELTSGVALLADFQACVGSGSSTFCQGL